jgi:hypothetical protein
MFFLLGAGAVKCPTIVGVSGYTAPLRNQGLSGTDLDSIDGTNVTAAASACNSNQACRTILVDYAANRTWLKYGAKPDDITEDLSPGQPTFCLYRKSECLLSCPGASPTVMIWVMYSTAVAQWRN